MAEINLRTYVKEVDDLIEEGQQLEEAIAHCRHILKTYPKHINTYRLLGKAYLESQRFGDAGDIFQRVLSAIPHDFVSHVGMAIIREDEGNLDAAIWHMERSSESQPGNAAIEEELKRLIGKRDGIEPQRVRPTRGALARMYYHGELYSYATSELRIALEEDSDRPDLQLLLADTYWRTDQRLEAADLCRQILEKLPHCFLGNQITAALLQASGKPEEAAINLRRLIALDPYMAFIDNSMDSPTSVDASAVQLERLRWAPGQPMPSAETTQPDWAASLGVDLRGEKAKSADQEAIPSWLQSPAAPSEMGDDQESSPIHPFAGAKAPPGTDIPEWMRDAGWVKRSGEATEGPLEPLEEPGIEETAPAPPQPLEPAEMPGWLSEITPQGPPQEEPAQIKPITETPTPVSSVPAELEDSQELPDWIQDISPEVSEDVPEALDLPYEDEPEVELPPTQVEPSEPEFIGEPEVEAFAESLSEDEIEEDEIPEYPPWLEPSTPGATDTIVSWLGDKSLEKQETVPEDIPTWMRGTGPLEELPSQKQIIPESPLEPLAEPPPTFEEVSGISEEPAMADDLPESVIPLDEAAPEWLDEISELEEELPTPKTVQPEEAPDWLADTPTEAEELPTLEEATPPAWLSDLDEEEAGEEAWEEVEQPEEAIQAAEQAPDWLSEVIREDVLDEEGEQEEVKPDWLDGFAEAEMAIQEEEISDADEAPDWLTEMSLVEEVDTSPQTDAAEEPPEWLKGLADTEISQIEETPTELEPPPDWVTEEVFPDEAEEVVPSQETPEWLEELTEPSLEGEQPPDVTLEPSASEVTAPTEEHPEWLEAIDEVPSEGEAISPETIEPLPEPSLQEEPISQEDVPDWLQDISEETPEVKVVSDEVIEEPPTPAAVEEAISQAEIPDWLDELSEAPFEDEAVVDEDFKEIPEPSIVIEEPPQAEVPDWLEEVSETPIEIEAVIEEVADEVLEPSFDGEEVSEAPIEIEAIIKEVADEVPEPSLEGEAVPVDEAPDWLQDMVGAPVDAEVISEEIVEGEPDRPQEELVEEVSEVEAFAEEAPDWIQEIEASVEEVVIIPSEEIEQFDELTVEEEVTGPELEEEAPWQPEFTPTEIETIETPEPAEIVSTEVPQPDLDESFDWLQESAQEVASEPEMSIPAIEPAYSSDQIEEFATSIEDPMDDDEVFSFLDGLAARETGVGIEAPIEEPGAIEPTFVDESIEEKLIEEHDLPEDLDESLDWLEQLADEEPMIDFSPPVFVEETEDVVEAEVPQWLEEVAEKPEGTPPEVFEETHPEPTASVQDLSSMETIISKRPTGEEITEEDLVEELPVKPTLEPEPIKPTIDEKEETHWELISEEKETPPIEETPPISPEPEIPVAEIPESETTPLYAEMPTEPLETGEEIAPPSIQEPVAEPLTELINKARIALESGEINDALSHYSKLIEEDTEIDAVIQDLKSAIEKTPQEPMLWQTLGDALMKSGQLSKAIDAYRRGMEAV